MQIPTTNFIADIQPTVADLAWSSASIVLASFLVLSVSVTNFCQV